MSKNASSCLQGPHLPARLLRHGRPAYHRKGLCRSGAVAVKSADSNIRYDLVARVRREIAAGTYDTPEKLDAAMARLLARCDLS